MRFRPFPPRNPGIKSGLKANPGLDRRVGHTHPMHLAETMIVPESVIHRLEPAADI